MDFKNITQIEINELAEICVQHLSLLNRDAADLANELNEHRRQLWFCIPSLAFESESDRVQTFSPGSPGTDDHFTSLLHQLTEFKNGSQRRGENGLLVTDNPRILGLIANMDTHKRNLADANKVLKRILSGQRGSELLETSNSEQLAQFSLARDEYLAKGRDRAFNKALRDQGISETNMQLATRRIWVTPHDTLAFNYVWSKAHYRKRTLTGATFKALRAAYFKEFSETNANAITDALESNNIHDSTELFKLAFTKPVLRANVKYGIEGETEWTNRHAPGITVIPQADPPRIRWTAKPGAAEIELAKNRWMEKHYVEEVKITPGITVYREVSHR